MQSTAQGLSPKQHIKQELSWIKRQIHGTLGFQKSTAILILVFMLVAKAKENCISILYQIFTYEIIEVKTKL